MVATVSTVECVICHTTHLEVPPEREGIDHNGEHVVGVWPKDFTYYRDLYKDVYSVICKGAHDSVLAPKLSKMES